MANVIPIDRVTAKSVNANNPNPTKLVRKEYLIALRIAVKDKMSDVTWQAPFLSEDGVSDSEWSPKDCRRRECQLKIE